MGRAPISAPVMVWLISASSVFNCDASALMVMESVALPTCSTMSMRSFCATCTRMPVCVNFLNPGTSTVIS